MKLLLGATGAVTDPHEKMLDALAGNPADSETHDQMVQDLMRILEAQRIVSLDTLFQLADHIEAISKGEKLDPKLVNTLASRISEIQLPRASLSSNEKNAMGFGYWTDRHLDAERKLNLRAAIEKAAGDPEKVKDTRALLAPLLRDTLLSFNYAHYAPPGAQILYTNPIFVRSHDFLGMQGSDHTWRPTELYGTGWPSNGGGRLVGSLSSLPYALAEAEQNFLIPTQTQALIWGDLVPQMILSAKIPRFWKVTPAQLHWVGLHLRYGRELLAEAALDSDLRTQVVASLGMLAAPGRTRQVAALLEQGSVREAMDRVTPSEFYLIAREVGAGRNPQSSCLLAELKHMAESSPEGDQPRGRLPRLRHTQADPGELLRARASQPAHLPHPDGLLQPHHGGELGIQHPLLGRPRRRAQRRAHPAQRAHPRVDPQAGGTDLRVAPRRLARRAEVPALRRRRCSQPHASPGNGTKSSPAIVE